MRLTSRTEILLDRRRLRRQCSPQPNQGLVNNETNMKNTTRNPRNRQPGHIPEMNVLVAYISRLTEGLFQSVLTSITGSVASRERMRLGLGRIAGGCLFGDGQTA